MGNNGTRTECRIRKIRSLHFPCGIFYTIRMHANEECKRVVVKDSQPFLPFHLHVTEICKDSLFSLNTNQRNIFDAGQMPGMCRGKEKIHFCEMKRERPIPMHLVREGEKSQMIRDGRKEGGFISSLSSCILCGITYAIWRFGARPPRQREKGKIIRPSPTPS